MKSLYLSIITLILCFFWGAAQTMEELVNDPEYIKTVRFNTPPEQMIPIFELGKGFVFAFDDIIGDEADYYYQFEHYDHDWRPSRLFKNEFLEGIDDMRIFNYRNSFTTIQSYSHYELSIPNQFTQGFKVSGNYMIHIYDSDRDLVFSRKFMLVDNKATVGVGVRRARNLEYVEEKQRVEFEIDSQEIQFLQPNEQLKVSVIQNLDLEHGIHDLQPQFNLGNRQVYRYDAESSFYAGEEFLHFENRDFRAPNINIDYVLKKELYEAFLFKDGPRYDEPYGYFPDINGGYTITTIDNEDNAVQAEYVRVHFVLDGRNINLPPDGELHVMGNYNGFQVSDENTMRRNDRTGDYECSLLLKQGFYNYRYSLVLDNGEVENGFVSGDKWQTENDYTVLAYFRTLGGRYDQLIGVGRGNSRDITN